MTARAHLRRIVRAFALALAWLPSASPYARNALLPETALSGLPLQWASERVPLAVAGRRMMLRAVVGSRSASEVTETVRAEWQRLGGPVRVHAGPVWHEVSRARPVGIEILQLRDTGAGACEGYLVVWHMEGPELRRLDQAAGSLAHRLLPASALVLAEVASSGSNGGRTLVAWLRASVDEADRQLLDAAASLGMKERVHTLRPAPNGIERARFFATPGSELALSLHARGSGTALVIHLMETAR